MKKKNRIIISIIAILIVTAVITTILILRHEKNKTLVYLSNGRLYLYEKKETKELGRGTLESVKFSENNHDLFVYKVENDLFIHNSEENKIIENAKDYFFLGEKVIVIDIDGKLSIYDKELQEIEEIINQFIGISDNLVLYIKDSSLMAYNAKDNKKETICDKVYAAYLTENKKNIIYKNNNNFLIKYDLDKKEEIELVKDATLYNCDEVCNKLYYIDKDNELFYYDGKESKEIDEKVSMIQKTDFQNNLVIYSKDGNKNYIYITSKGEEKELEDITVPKIILQAKENLYYQSFEGNIYTFNTKTLDFKKIKENSFDSIKLLNDKLVYVSYEEDKNNLYMDDKKISEDIVPSSSIVDDKNDIIYYLKNEDNQNNLYKYYKNKNELIDKNVYKYYVLDNKEVYYIKDYKLTKEYGDLYKYKNESNKVLEQVSDITGFENRIENK